MTLRNGVQLITYPDSLGGNLRSLKTILDNHASGALTGIHILPFFPSTADRGFCPTRYDVVDPAFGTWEDIRAIADDFDLMVDLILNHISSESEYFKDYVRYGKQSKYRDFFLQIQKVYGTERIPLTEDGKIYTRKPSLPEREVTCFDGTKEWIWQTFEHLHQVDMDVNSEIYRETFTEFIEQFARNGVKMIRIDAVAYVTKRAGTNCFMVEPDIWNFLKWVESKTTTHQIALLPELHSHYTRQLQFSQHGYWVYDFNLPLLLVYTLEKSDSSFLKKWLSICPRQQVTTLDTHDGIPVEDLKDIMSDEAIQDTANLIIKRGANVNNNYVGGKEVMYQLNCTYFEALGKNEIKYLLSRAIQFFCPGIPQVYYTGLLVGFNDYGKLDAYSEERIGGWGRDVNRHNYSMDEVEENFRRSVVQQLLELCRLRSNHHAFEGDITVCETIDSVIEIVWKNHDHIASLRVDLNILQGVISYSDNVNPHVFHKLIIAEKSVPDEQGMVEIRFNQTIQDESH